jgi:hypothetical protein
VFFPPHVQKSESRSLTHIRKRRGWVRDDSDCGAFLGDGGNAALVGVVERRNAGPLVRREKEAR